MACPLQSPQEESAALLAKRRRINELRETIAILDAELQWQERQFQARAASGFGLWI